VTPATALANLDQVQGQRGAGRFLDVRLAWLVIVALVAAPASAHAMGAYIELDVAAWNADGSAVLLTRTTTSSGTVGASHEYLLIGVADTEPLVVSFDDTRDPDVAAQQIDRATCMRNAARLKKALTARHFRSVMIRAERCSSDRVVVQPSRSAPPPARRSTVDLPALGAVPAGDVLTATGKLIVVLHGDNDDGTERRYATILAASAKGAYTVVAELD